MPKRYTSSGSSAAGTSLKTQLTVIGSTAVRPAVFFYSLGSSSTANDGTVQIAFGRVTTAGTAGGSVTPAPLDPADVAAVCTSGATHSSEPTWVITPYLMLTSINQRNTWQWTAKDGCEIVGTASTNNGLATRLVASANSIVLDSTIMWVE
jgi:hypothetical protein